MAYVFWALAGLFALFVICCNKSIRLSIEIIKCSADFVNDEPSTVILPLITVFVLCGFFVMWIFVAIYLYAVGTPYSTGASPVASI